MIDNFVNRSKIKKGDKMIAGITLVIFIVCVYCGGKVGKIVAFCLLALDWITPDECPFLDEIIETGLGIHALTKSK